MRAAGSRVTRELTPEERAEYIRLLTEEEKAELLRSPIFDEKLK